MPFALQTKNSDSESSINIYLYFNGVPNLNSWIHIFLYWNIVISYCIEKGADYFEHQTKISNPYPKLRCISMVYIPAFWFWTPRNNI
jgi:hypothetical protein